MKFKTLTGLIALTMCLNLVSCEGSTSNVKQTVININGAQLYENPSFESRKISIIGIGKTFIVEETINTDEKFIVGQNFSFDGDWIKPKEIDGFVFSSDLTDKNVEFRKWDDSQVHINLFGDLISENEEQKNIEYPNGVFPQYITHKIYENVNYTRTSGDGCWDNVYQFQNFNIAEVYHQLVSDNTYKISESEYWVPTFIGQLNNSLRFESEGAATDLKMEIKGDGIIEITSYDCT